MDALKILTLLSVIAVSLAADVEYIIHVKTSEVNYADTDANVYVRIYGTDGITPEFHLYSPYEDLFEKGSYDTFHFISEYVGRITRITIRHDESGKQSGWVLGAVHVNIPEVDGDLVYWFPCDKEFADNSPLGISATIYPNSRC